jgi:hypothetical protein
MGPVYFSTTLGMASTTGSLEITAFHNGNATAYLPAPGTYLVKLTVVTPRLYRKGFGDHYCSTRPIVTITPNPVTVCPGTPVTLTASINANGNTMCPAYRLTLSNGTITEACRSSYQFPYIQCYGLWYVLCRAHRNGYWL